MKNIRVFLAENFHFLEVKFSIYLNRRVLVMHRTEPTNDTKRKSKQSKTDSTQLKIKSLSLEREHANA